MASEVEVVKLILEGAQVLATLIAAFIDGDDGPEPRRAVKLLPAELRSKVLLARERLELEAAVREALADPELGG